MQRYLRFPIEYLWALTVLVGIFVIANTNPIRPHDFWFHLEAGRVIASTGEIPQVDTYSYTARGEPYPSYQIFHLMDRVFYWAYQTGGPAGERERCEARPAEQPDRLRHCPSMP